MGKSNLLLTAILCFGLCVTSCSVSRNQPPSAIGILPLNNFSLVNKNMSTDTAFMVIRNEAELNSLFTPPSPEQKTDLYGKTAVAIVFKAPSSLRFQRAEYAGPRINIYTQSCTMAQAGCTTGLVFLATVPKVGSAKNVQFFIDSAAKSTIQL